MITSEAIHPVEIPSDDLLVAVYGGTARSGKGTTVSYIAANHDSVATEETGADYRLVTKVLLDQHLIDQDMPKDVLQRKVQCIGAAVITEIVVARNDIVRDYGVDSLRTPDVNNLVPEIAELPFVRQPVKEGFKRRVEAVRDSGEYDVLLVDGRNLGPIIERVEGAHIFLDTFLYCDPEEGARREVLRLKLDPTSEEARIEFENQKASIEYRNLTDINRLTDPVRPRINPIDYWQEDEPIERTSAFLANIDANNRPRTHFYIPKELERRKLCRQDPTIATRIGVGTLAVSSSRQIYLDTTPFKEFADSKRTMELAADQMFEESLGAVRLSQFDRILDDSFVIM